MVVRDRYSKELYRAYECPAGYEVAYRAEVGHLLPRKYEELEILGHDQETERKILPDGFKSGGDARHGGQCGDESNAAGERTEGQGEGESQA